MTELLGSEVTKYFECLDDEPIRGIRLNLSRMSHTELSLLNDLSLEPVPWTENGYYVKDNDAELSKRIEYHQGLYYIQEPSAMSPAAMLPIDPDDIVLDLCAAPGGKATQLASCCRFLFANDISATRANALLKNIENAGLYNVAVMAEKPSHLADCYGEYFDKILVDAPCSGEGMFRRNSALIEAWQDRGPEYYHELQKEILNDACRMLKDGGMLLYSTCTFSPLEDEETILDFLGAHQDMKVVEIPGRHDLFKEGRQGLSKAARLYPHILKGEGHFLCLMRKEKSTDFADLQSSAADAFKALCKQRLPENISDSFIRRISRTTPRGDECRHCSYEIIRIGEKYLLRPSDIMFYPGIRFLRTGLLVGEDKKGRFWPAHPLALALKKDEYMYVLDLKEDSDRAIRYLKGETLSAGEEEFFINNDSAVDGNGECKTSVADIKAGPDKMPSAFDVLIIYRGISLGFGRINNGKVKNMYPKSWVMR